MGSPPVSLLVNKLTKVFEHDIIGIGFKPLIWCARRLSEVYKKKKPPRSCIRVIRYMN